MAFQLKTFKQILEEWISYIVGHSPITDVNPGSVVRTIGEASALELAQTYIQMQSILNLFSIDKASGSDLDERALDFDIERERAGASSGVVTIGDSDLTAADAAFSTLVAALTTGSTQAQIQTADYADFPASGSIIVDRGNGLRELIAYSSKTGPDLLNLVGNPVSAHAIGAEVYLSTVGADRPITNGTQVKTLTGGEVVFKTTAAAVLLDGDISVDVTVESVATGEATNVDAGAIVVFVTPPFPTATVTNAERTQGGQDQESDQALRARIKETQQALSSSTATRIRSAALTVEITDTGQRVFNAKVIEPVAPGESLLYISDGTVGYTPTTQNVTADEIIIFDSETAVRRGYIINWPLVADTEILYVSLERGVATSVAPTTLTDTTKSWVVNEWAGYVMWDANRKKYTVSSNTADTLTLSPIVAGDEPVVGVYALVNPAATVYGSGGSKLVKDTDYIINDTNGQFELDDTIFPSGLNEHDMVLALYDSPTPAYTYYDGLLQEVQKVINGDPNDLDTYPGVKAAGSKVVIDVPTIITIVIDVSVTAQDDVDESTIRPLVVNAIIDYINALDIGDDVKLARIIGAAIGIDGVEDVSVNLPVSNVVITDSQLAKTNSSNVTVS